MDKFVTRIRSKAYQGAFWFVVLSLVGVTGLPILFKSFLSKIESVAVVDGYPITNPELNRRINIEQRRLSSIRERFGDAAEGILNALGLNKNVKEAAIESLIQEKILLSAADTLHVSLAPEFVIERLRDPQVIANIFGESIPQYIVDQRGMIMPERLKHFIKRQGMIMNQFEQAIEDELRESMTLALVQGAATLSKAGIQERKNREFTDKTFKIMAYSLQPYIKAEEGNKLSDEAIYNFYVQKNQETQRYWTPEERSGVVWSFDQSKYIAKSGSKNNFEEQFMRDAQTKLHVPEDIFASFVQCKNGIKRDLRKKTSLDLSQDTATAYLFQLAPGHKKAFVRGKTGYIVQLDSIEPRAALSFDKVKERVAADMYKEKAQSDLLSDLNFITNDTKGKAKVSTLTLAAHATKEKLEQLRKDGLPVDRIQRMAVPGQIIVSLTPTFGYRIELLALGHQQEVAKEESAALSPLVREEEQRMVYEFIASLREHAKISMNTQLLKKDTQDYVEYL